jgi:glucose/arabinose dehydrogenase
MLRRCIVVVLALAPACSSSTTRPPTFEAGVPDDVGFPTDRGFSRDVPADRGPADVPRADVPPADVGPCADPAPMGELTGTPWCDLPLPDVAGLTVPPEFCIRRYGTVPTARVLKFAPNGDLFVSSPGVGQAGGAAPGLGAIVVAPDDNHDGVSDGNVTYLDGVETLHGLLFRDREIVYTTQNAVMRVPYCHGDRAAATPRASHDLVARLDDAVRYTHTLAESADGRLLVSMGQHDQNTCPTPNPRAGSVLRIGTGAPVNGEIVVEGFRNPMYLRCKEWGACYAAELTGDGWDSFGGTEKLIEIRQGDRYGFPCCIDRAMPTPMVQGTPISCADIAASVQTYPLHDTPFGFDWAPSSWPAPYSGGYFVGLHGWVGSWTNAGVQWAPVDATTHRPTRPTEFFVRGFGNRGSGNNGQRVTDLVFARDGRMFIADDHAGEIYWIAPRTLRMPAR